VAGHGRPSVVWRPLLFGRPHRLSRLRSVKPLRERIDARAQHLQLLLLSVHHVAQLDVGALQERNLRLNPLEVVAVHFDSVTIIGQVRAPGAGCRQLKPNWSYPPFRRPVNTSFRGVTRTARRAQNACNSSSAELSNILIQLRSVAPWRRVYPARTGD
jgi:hypothetical protein